MFDTFSALDGRLQAQPVFEADFEALLALRVRAMRPSLEALGRFDLARARERFAAGFAPACMQHLVLDGQRVGCVTLRPTDQALHLDHLYIEPTAQGQGLGAWVLAWVKQQGQAHGLSVQLSALVGSGANRFYQRHGFVETGRGEFDIDYRWSPAVADVAASAQVRS
jgi:GNAT superfamily N-acetyltransferase